MEQDRKLTDKILLANNWERVDKDCKQAHDDGHPMHVWQFNVEGKQVFECQLTNPQPTFAYGEGSILILYFDTDYARILINLQGKLETVLNIIVEHQDKAAQYMKQGMGNEMMEELVRPIGVACPTCVFVEDRENGPDNRTMVM